ncbi:MAG: EutN/CcmL family microcompartment protein [Oscillospiraceae bacterium]
MQVGRVIGKIWATRKEESLGGLKMLIVKPINYLDEVQNNAPVIAADIIGAGVGEIVLLVSGSSARTAVGDMTIPIDTAVIAIVDDKEIDSNLIT